jgi:hypothetical protein
VRHRNSVFRDLLKLVPWTAFDKLADDGYCDFGFWAKLDALGCRLVTRFKANTPLNQPRETPLEPGSTVLSDRIGFLPARQAMNRKNPMADAVREIVVRTETGETLRLLTNDLDAPA